jgi:hypothetical protein
MQFFIYRGIYGFHQMADKPVQKCQNIYDKSRLKIDKVAVVVMSLQSD